MSHKEDLTGKYTFPQKVWIVGGVFALITVVLLLLKATFNVFLLILAGTLIAVFFRGLASFIRKKTKWKHSLALAVSIIGTFVFVGLMFWLIGAKVQSQVSQLADTLPATVENVKTQLNKSTAGQKLINELTSKQSQEKLKKIASQFFKSTFGILGDIYVIFFIAIFFTASPQLYKKAVIQIAPKAGRKKAGDLLNKLGVDLTQWLKGKLFAMLVVFILTGIGLAIMGVPMWLALALIAGILNFIPNFGPLIAMIPAVLVGFKNGPATAAFVAALYIVVQVLESNFITPKVQQKLISIPPAAIIITQLLVGSLTGVWGLILATPLIVIVMVLVKELYVKRQ